MYRFYLIILLLGVVSCSTNAPSRAPSSDDQRASLFRETIAKFVELTKDLVPAKVKYRYIIDDISGNARVIFNQDHFEILLGKKYFNELASVNLDSTLALFCHELGHAVMSEGEYVSQEEVADYWTTKKCLPYVLPHFERGDTAKHSFYKEFEKSCRKAHKKKNKIKICVRSLEASYFFRVQNGIDLRSREKYQPIEFNDTYERLSCTPYKNGKPPRIEQCGLNHLIAGSLNIPKPACENLILMGDFMDTTTSYSDMERWLDEGCKGIKHKKNNSGAVPKASN